MDMLDDEKLGMVAGGAGKVDFIDGNGEILCTVNDDLNLDKHPMFERAARIRAQLPGGRHVIYTPDVIKVVCKLSRHEQLSAQENETCKEWIEKGIGMQWA